MLYGFPHVMMGWFQVLASPGSKAVICGIRENWPHEVSLFLLSTIFCKLGKSQSSAQLPEEGFVRRTRVMGHVVSDMLHLECMNQQREKQGILLAACGKHTVMFPPLIASFLYELLF